MINGCHLCGTQVRSESVCESCYKHVCSSHSNYASGKKYCSACLKNQTPQTTTTAISNLTNCLDCKKEISKRAETCPHCGRPIKTSESIQSIETTERKKDWNPGIAAVLSLIIPGAGQMYKGEIGIGIGCFIAIAILYGSSIVLGAILHLICVINAASGKKETGSN